MQQYKDLVKDIIENGTPSDDRTGTGTRSLFGRQLRFNLQEGFPIVTLKKTFWKGVLCELLWILQGSTNTKFLNDHNVKIWNEWQFNDASYPSNTRKITRIDARSSIGANYSGDYSTSGLNAVRGSVDDRLRGIWTRMMKRCYNKSNHNYKFYGAIGIRVNKDWHDCAQFISDVKELPNWRFKLNDWNNFNLDKDYFQSSTYSKDTCVWLHKKENNLYTKQFKPFRIILNSVSMLCLSYQDAENQTGIPKSTLFRWQKSGVPKDKNLKFEIVDPISHGCFRYEFTPGELGPVYGKQLRDFNNLDQLKLVIDQIKTNPNSRRILYTLWNPAQLKDMALPPCVGLVTQFYIRDGKLSCQTYQRSADTFLGVPFDIASYACLTHLIAAECGLEVGDLVYTFGDVHIYNNHIKQCEEMLKREPKELPKLTVNLSMGLLDFIDRTKYMEWTDIQSHVCLTGYDPHPGIKAEVSV